MTSPTASLLVGSPLRALRADRLRAALLVAAVALVVGLAVAAAPRTGAPVATPRTALVVDAAGRPHTALARVRAAAAPGVAVRAPRTPPQAAAGGRHLAAPVHRPALARVRAAAAPGVAVRAPRTAAEAAADVRYFAAQVYRSVVAVGPLARGAARTAARAYPRTRFAVWRTLP